MRLGGSFSQGDCKFRGRDINSINPQMFPISLVICTRNNWIKSGTVHSEVLSEHKCDFSLVSTRDDLYKRFVVCFHLDMIAHISPMYEKYLQENIFSRIVNFKSRK